MTQRERLEQLCQFIESELVKIEGPEVPFGYLFPGHNATIEDCKQLFRRNMGVFAIVSDEGTLSLNDFEHLTEISEVKTIVAVVCVPEDSIFEQILMEYSPTRNAPQTPLTR